MTSHVCHGWLALQVMRRKRKRTHTQEDEAEEEEEEGDMPHVRLVML